LGYNAAMSNSSSETLQWRRVQAHIEQLVGAGTLRPGARLPSERAMQSTLGVSRQTVRRAMQEMAQAQIVRIEQGRGTFLHDRKISYRLGERVRFHQNIAASSAAGKREILLTRILPAKANVADGLALAIGTPVLLVKAIARADGQVISLGWNYYPADRFPGLGDAIRQTLSNSAALRMYGITDYRRLRTKIRARMPTPQEARTLHMLPTTPVFEVERVDADMAGVRLSYGESLWVAERVEFDLDGFGSSDDA